MSKVYTINTGNKREFLSEYAFLSGSRITGSLFGTASWAQSASVATSASFAPIGPGTSQSIALFNSSNTVSSSIVFQSGSNIGINTNNPQARLHLNGGALRIDDGSGNHSGFSFNTTTGLTQTNNNFVTLLGGLQVQSTAGNNSYFVGTGNVGIGTTNPAAKLDVRGSALIGSGSSLNNAGATNYIALSTNTIGQSTAIEFFASDGTYNPRAWIVHTNSINSQSLTFNSTFSTTTGYANFNFLNGNVGIGTTSPTARLHVTGSTGGIFEVDGVGALNALYVSASGNVGIGIINPSTKLQVSGSIVATAYNEPTTLGAVLAADGTNALLYARNGSTSWAPMYIDATTLYLNAQSSGNVGIGTTSPSNRLQIQGNVSASSYTSSISNAVGFFGTASRAVSSSRTDSASRADSSATIDVLSGGSTTGLGIYSGSLFGTASWSNTASFALNAGGATAGFPFSGNAVITGSLLVSSSGIVLSGSGLTGSVFGTSSWANTASVVTTNTVSYTAGAGLSGGGTATLGGSSVTIDAVAGAGISLTAPTNDAININTGSTHFTDGVKTKLNTEGVFSSSAQVNHNTTTNYVANQHIDHTSVSINAGNGLTGGGTIAASRTLTVRYVPSTDDRATNSPPASASAGLYADFKENATDGLSDGGLYHGVLTFRPYGATSDFSGGPAHQLGFTERGGLYLRTGSSNSWGPWGRFAYQTGSIFGTASFAISSSFTTTASFATTSSFAQTGGAVANALTFSNTGNGAATGTTYNGSAARTISYNSVGAIQGTQTAYSAITSGSSGDWFPLFTMTESTNGPVYCSVSTYAHSSVSFVALDGYGPSGFNHIVILGSVWNANGGYANISGVRITDAGIVQIKLTWTTGPLVDIDVALTCAGTPPALSANLSVDNSGTINDSVDLTTLNGYIRTENGYYGGTNLVLNANGASYLNGGSIGVGTTSPSALLHVSASGTTNDLLIGSTGSPKLFVSASGNIGINTLSPAERLRVNGTFASNAIWTTGAGLTNWGSYSTAYGTLTWDVGYARVHATAGNRLDLGANGNNAHITITGSGNVGIGITSSFSNKLHVQGNVSASSYTSSISDAVGFLGTSSWAVSASRASSSATIDVLSGGSTTGLGIYSGSFSGSFFGALTGTGGGSGTGFPYSGSAVITGSLLISGSGLQVTGSTTTSGSILPAGDNVFDLGSSARRWANLYTGDLVLSNEGSSGNNVDGTTGNWTVQEGDAHLYIINNKSGKKYKFVLEEIE